MSGGRHCVVATLATSEPYPAAARPGARGAGAALLAVDDIHTCYGDSYVLQGLSLAVPRGPLPV